MPWGCFSCLRWRVQLTTEMRCAALWAQWRWWQVVYESACAMRVSVCVRGKSRRRSRYPGAQNSSGGHQRAEDMVICKPT